MTRRRAPLGPGHILSARTPRMAYTALPFDPEKVRPLTQQEIEKKYGPGGLRPLRPRANREHPPRLPEHTMIVRAVGEAVVYTFEGAQIPNDKWVTVPVSAHLINAVRAGDLEAGEAGPQEHESQSHIDASPRPDARVKPFSHPRAPITPNAPAKASAPKRSRGGANPSRPWEGLLAHLDPLVADRTITTWRQANSAARTWRDDNKKVLSDSRIRRGLKTYRPHWKLKDD